MYPIRVLVIRGERVYHPIVGSEEEVMLMVETEQLTETVDRVAALLGIARATAYRAVRTGEIPSVRIGRRLLVPREALARLLRGEVSLRAGEDGERREA